MGAMDQGVAEANNELLCEHVHIENQAWVQVAKLAPMHMVNWREALNGVHHDVSHQGQQRTLALTQESFW